MLIFAMTQLATWLLIGICCIPVAHCMTADEKKGKKLFEKAMELYQAGGEDTCASDGSQEECSNEGKPKSVELFEKAAAKGWAPAQHVLATLCNNGELVEKDQQRAVELFRTAAAQNYPLSQLELAHMYDRLKDYEQAVEYFGQASANQNLEPKQRGEAQLKLAMMFYLGRGTPTDETMAMKLLQMASDNDNGEACHVLGSHYASSQNPTAQAKGEELRRKAQRLGYTPPPPEKSISIDELKSKSK